MPEVQLLLVYLHNYRLMTEPVEDLVLVRRKLVTFTLIEINSHWLEPLLALSRK